MKRRQLLQLLAATSAGAMLPTLGSRHAFAQSSSDIPLRIVFLSLPHGALRGTWEPFVEGFQDYTAVDPWIAPPGVFQDFSFRGPMAQLEPYRPRANIFLNLDMRSAAEDQGGGVNAHLAGRTHELVADDRIPGEALAGNISIDQRIAQFLQSPTPVTPLPSLEMVVKYYRSEMLGLSYSGAGQSLPMNARATEVFARLFQTGETETEEDARNRAKRTSVFNLVQTDSTALMNRLPLRQRQKIQQQLDERQSLYERLSLGANVRSGNRPDASILDLYNEIDDWGHARPADLGPGPNDTYNHLAESQIRLAAAALHTDSTRVVTLNFDTPEGGYFGYTSNMLGTSDHHDLVHKVSGDEPDFTGAEFEAGQSVIRSEEAYSFGWVKFFLDHLQSLQEVDGTSLLDHTVVVVGGHIGEGSHDLTRLPWIVFGDAHGRFRTGQFTRFARDVYRGTNPPTRMASLKYNSYGRAHNDLFLTLLRGFDIDDAVFGNPSICTGPIAEMLV